MAKDDEALSGPVDVAGPWTIKSVPTDTRLKVTEAARRENVTVGQWLERRVREWEEQGSPVRLGLAVSAPVSDLGRLATVLSGMGAAGLPVPKGHVARVTAALLREAGLAPRRSPAVAEAPRLSARLTESNAQDDAA